MADEYSELLCHKGIQPLSQFCDVQCHENSSKHCSMPPSQYHVYQSACLFSTHQLSWLCTHQTWSTFRLTRTEREVCRGGAQYCWDVSLTARRIFLLEGLLLPWCSKFVLQKLVMMMLTKFHYLQSNRKVIRRKWAIKILYWHFSLLLPV